MATVRKIERPVCEIEELQRKFKCKRQGNWEVESSTGPQTSAVWHICYRHRWRAYDIVAEMERAETPFTSHVGP